MEKPRTNESQFGSFRKFNQAEVLNIHVFKKTYYYFIQCPRTEISVSS
jgi:hypothetical protein